MSSEFNRRDLIDIFIAEASEAMDVLTKAFHLSGGLAPAPAQLQKQYASAHKVREAAALYGYEGLALMGTLLESILEEAPLIEESHWPKTLEILRGMVSSFQSQLKVVAAGGAEDTSVSVRWKGEVAELFPALSAAVPSEAALLALDYLVPALDAEVLSYFTPEAQEYIESLESQLLRLEKRQHSPEAIDRLFRTAHTLKGSAYTVGFQSIGDLTHCVEDFVGAVREGRIKILAGHIDVLLRSIDVVRLLIRRDSRSLGLLRRQFGVTMQELQQLKQPSTAPVIDSRSASHLVAAPVKKEICDQETVDSIKAADGKTSEDSNVIRVRRDRLERLFNLVGDLVIGRGRLEQRLYTVEQLSQQVMSYKDQLVESVHTFEKKYTFTLSSTSSGPSTDPIQAVTYLDGSSSVEFDWHDDFNVLTRRISEVTTDISEVITLLNDSISGSHEDMNHLAQLTRGMRDEIAQARLVPINTSFTRFHRATREMARTTGKEVSLVTSGDDTVVDAAVVERLIGPLIHLVRNAVYHGIEPSAIRVLKAKPEVGTIYLRAAHRENALLIEVEDDGAGLDVEKIMAKAIDQGLISPEAARSMSESEVVKFIFVPGFSTTDKIDNQAGRGVGMDVVKHAVESMNGHIDVESVRDVGTKFTLNLPCTLLINTALMVGAGRECYAIPLPAVREVTMLTTGAHQRIGERSILHIGDEAVEVQSLQQIFTRRRMPVEIGKPVVIVQTADGLIGLLVDELLGRQNIVMKPLGSLNPLDRSIFGGATTDSEGRVILVLDPARLLVRQTQDTIVSEVSSGAMADSLVPYVETLERKAAERLLLLIDDSLSIRKFVGRMLESAGYEVETAVDGEDGLRKASAQDYRLILIDLEMPKLNGYEVIQRLRNCSQTHQTPIVGMTARTADKYRQMARDAGMNSCITKPVEERALLQEVERLIGREATARH